MTTKVQNVTERKEFRFPDEEERDATSRRVRVRFGSTPVRDWVVPERETSMIGRRRDAIVNPIWERRRR